MRTKLNKRGQMYIYILFIFFLSVLLIFSAVVAPLGATITASFYSAGADIWNDQSEKLDQINDPQIKQFLNKTYDEASSAVEDNITITSGLYKYGWIIILVLVFLFFLIISRSLIERGQMG